MPPEPNSRQYASWETKTNAPRPLPNALHRVGERNPGWNLELQGLQVFAEGRPEVVALQREVDRGLEHAQLVARVVTDALEAVSVDFLGLEQALDAIGKLQLAAGAQRSVLQQIED